jgi:pyruvate,water dikinase
MAKQWLFWFEELGKEHNDLVGKKCANLGEMCRMGLRVPSGFALSSDAYDRFLSKTNVDQEIREYIAQHVSESPSLSELTEVSTAIRQMVESKEMPKDIAEAITSQYDELSRKSGTPDVAVSVRSAGRVSHPGQYETYLNVKGRTDLLEKILKVWSSPFNPRSLANRARKGLPLDTDPIGVAVLEMINARAAGVTLTADPNTGDHSKIVCEANWGLGESVVSGHTTPDFFLLDKESLEILEKRLGDKEMCVLCTETGVIEEDVPPDKRSCFCVEDKEIKEIANYGKLIEEYFKGVPQDVEWTISDHYSNGTRIFFLQTRPAIVPEKKSTTDQILDLIMHRKF